MTSRQLRFPISLSYDGPLSWIITEHLGGQRVGHGRLRYDQGQYVITSTSGTTTYDQSWRAAVAEHLRRR